MNVALGFKPHSGWAALVALGASADRRPVLVDRRRIELVEPGDHQWARQPYHAAERMRRDEPAARGEASAIVARGIRSARQLALREVRAAAKRVEASGHRLTACAVLMTAPLPDWSVDDILAVHFRMHKAEGVLFREALARAVERCGLPFVPVPEKTLSSYAAQVLGVKIRTTRTRIARMRETCGPPWGQDQVDAAFAAWLALVEPVKTE